ncbi:MAG TPA: hypothetical protein VF733_00925 [Candidatus Saccharimonadales bacterium]
MGLRVEYPELGKRRGVTVADFLGPTEAKCQARPILNTLISSYQKQFEQGRHPRLPQGLIKRSFGLRHYCTYLHSHFQEGGQLVVVQDETVQGEINAFCTTSYAHRVLGGGYDGCYLKDVVAFPHRSGLGSLVMHAALKFGQFKPDDAVVLHAFKGSKVNGWYERHHIKLDPTASPEQYEFDADHRLPLVTHRTPDSYYLGDVIQSLEKRYPHLIDGEPVL